MLLLLSMAALPMFAQNNCDTDCSVQCIGQINVSLDQDCVTEITPAMGAVGVEYFCNSFYTVELYDAYGYQLPQPYVDIDHHGQTLTYKVIENECGNSCWGTILVEYKYPPLINCPDDLTLSCGAINLLDLPEADGGCADFDVVLYSQTKVTLDCDPDYSSIITRTYWAYDDFGNESFCSHDIYIRRLDVDDIIFPGPATISCTDSLMRFDAYGFPIPWYVQALMGSGMADGIPIICDSEVDDGLYCPTEMDLSGVPLIPTGGAIAIIENDDPYGPEYIVEHLSDDTNTLLCNAFLTYTDMEIPNVPCKRKILRQWEVREWWCHTELSAGAAQLITIIDDEAPSFVCPSDFTVTNDYECAANIYLDPVDIYDACSANPQLMVQYPNGTLQSNGGYVNLDYGHNVLTYIASDGCYNQSTCEVHVAVSDLQAPVAICETYKVVSISNDSETLVFAEPFDNGSWDNCGIDRFEVRRMDSLCVANDTLFGESISFCCSDVGNEVMVVFRAYDWNDNYNDCMVRVEVQDKIAPRITCPPDQTIQCQDGYDINNLGIFFGEPTITDNCSNTQIVIETVLDDVNQCGVGTITRLFEVVSSDSVELAHCKQLITIENYQPFIGSNIQWPLDYVAEAVCEIENIDPEDLPDLYNYPTFSGQDQCALLGYQYDDQIFQSGNGCAHIKRTWTVINWCGSVNGEFETWTIPKPQLIEIFNTTAPVIDPQDDLAFESLDVNCEGDSVTVIRTATDDCEFLGWYHVLINSLGDTLAYGLSDTLVVYLPVGDFTVEWTVQDGCGNFDTDIQHLSMVNIKAPTPVCLNGLSASLVGMDLDSDGVIETEMVELWASDFDSGSSIASCGNPITFSFSSDTTHKNMVFDCDDIGRNDVQMWVTDVVTGYQDYCLTFIDILDNNNVDICEDTLSRAVVSGSIFTETLESIEGVEVNLGENINPVITDQNGEYVFDAMPLGGKYEVVPRKDINYLDGVSTLDLILIQRHILGMEQLDSPYKLLAADINDDGELSAADLLDLRKLILGIYEDLPMQDSWRFVDANFSFLDQFEPWSNLLPDSYDIDYLSGPMQVDFIGMKLGDVNENAGIGSAQIDQRSSQTMAFEIPEIKISKGETVLIPVRSSDYANIIGWQLLLQYEAEKGYISNVYSDLLDMEIDRNVNLINSEDGKIKLSYNSVTPIDADDKVLFTIEYTALADIHTDDLFESGTEIFFASEAYSDDKMISKITINTVKDSDVLSVNSEISLSPNPWVGDAELLYELRSKGNVLLEIYSTSGQLIYTDEYLADEGLNRYRLDRTMIPESGLYFAKLYSKDGVQETKMIILK